MRGGVERLTDVDRVHDELVSPQRRTPLEDGEVAAIGVDVEVVGVQVPEPDPHELPSQYGRTTPRSVRTPRSASIAV